MPPAQSRGSQSTSAMETGTCVHGKKHSNSNGGNYNRDYVVTLFKAKWPDGASRCAYYSLELAVFNSEQVWLDVADIAGECSN